MTIILYFALSILALVVAAGIVLSLWQKKVNDPPPQSAEPVAQPQPPVFPSVSAQPVEPPPAAAPAESPPAPVPVEPQPAPASPPLTITDLLFRPSPEVGAILDARVGTGGAQPAWPEEGFPGTYVPRRVRTRLAAGQVYACAFPMAARYMIVVGEGMGGRLVAWKAGDREPGIGEGAVDAAQFDGQPGQVWCLKAEKDCVVFLDP